MHKYQNARISLLLPVLNGERYLVKCLEALLAQDKTLHEIIVVDNNSTDSTKEIIYSFQEKYKQIFYVFESARTRGAARNAGVKVITGDVTVMTDVDCLVSSDWVRRLTLPIIEGKESVVTGYQYNLLPCNYWAREMQRKCDYFLNYSDDGPGYITFTDTKNLAIRTDLLKKVTFDVTFKALEDVDFEIRLRQRARFRFLPEVKVGHAHSASLVAVWKLAYERSYWNSQLYHKFVGTVDRGGYSLYEPVHPVLFCLRLCTFNLKVLYIQGWRHTIFFFVFDTAWKLGSAVGFLRKHPSVHHFSELGEKTMVVS